MWPIVFSLSCNYRDNLVGYVYRHGYVVLWRRLERRKEHNWHSWHVWYVIRFPFISDWLARRRLENVETSRRSGIRRYEFR
jgi:hypothetical protein